MVVERMDLSNHDKFLSHLDGSESAVWIVAQMLHGCGYSVTVPAATRAVKHEDWKAHADNGDLYINQRVEVKRLGVEFTSPADWPFRDKFIVCAKHSFDRAAPKPFAYVILAHSCRHAAAVFCSDCRHWVVEARTDSRYDGISQEFYLSPLEKVRFFAVPGMGGSDDDGSHA